MEGSLVDPCYHKWADRDGVDRRERLERKIFICYEICLRQVSNNNKDNNNKDYNNKENNNKENNNKDNNDNDEYF